MAISKHFIFSIFYYFILFLKTEKGDIDPEWAVQILGISSMPK
jgi:hypothetical protein